MYIAEPELTNLNSHVAEIGAPSIFRVVAAFSTAKEAIAFASKAKEANPDAYAFVSFSADGKKKCPMAEKRITKADLERFVLCSPQCLQGLPAKAWRAERGWIGYLLPLECKALLEQRRVDWEYFSDKELLVHAWKDGK